MDMFFVYVFVYVFVVVVVVIIVVVAVVVIVVGMKWNANDAYALLCIFWQKTFAGAGAEPGAQLCCTVRRKELVCINKRRSRLYHPLRLILSIMCRFNRRLPCVKGAGKNL